MTEIINDPCHNTYESITVSAVVVHAGYDVHWYTWCLHSCTSIEISDNDDVYDISIMY